ncbi:serine hydrolase domain-containing protein [Nocardia sp. NPDC051030]|uniref:serine hydrolase domain-containing protein n=1 Tax=Nocardia sp. NPDC051030 TaxID=3155162 RepID=UPI00342B0D85
MRTAPADAAYLYVTGAPSAGHLPGGPMRRCALSAGILLAAAVLAGTAMTSAEHRASDDRLQTGLDDTVKAAEVPGAQLVLTVGDRTTRINSGVGDIGTRAAFPDHAQVRIASNTKSFVAAVMLQLVGEGRIDLDSPVERYLPGVVHGPGGDGNVITVRNLLQHTSGIPDYFSDLHLDSVDALQRSQPIEALIRMGLDKPASFAPGAKSSYSNTNYLLAGQLVQQVTGNPIGAEVTNRILVPLGLHDTYWPSYPAESVLRGAHARAYDQFSSGLVDITDIDPGWGLPDGAMVSTGDDLNSYFMALLSGHVLAPAQLAEMQHTVPSGDARRKDDFGLGLFHWTTSCGLQAWGHDGTMNGTFVYGGATADRSVTVSMNKIPNLFGARSRNIDLTRVVDSALCSS